MPDDVKPDNTKKNTKKSLPKAAEPYKWQKGQSGNPGGRPTKKPISELYGQLLDDPEVISAIKNAVGKAIRGGNMAMVLQLKEMADRVEGKVTQPIEADVSVNLADAIAEARKRAGK